MRAQRAAAWLAGLWAGVLLGIAVIGAPAGFSVTSAEIAGRTAARMFAQEAYSSLAVAIVLFAILRSLARVRAEAGRGSVLSTDMLLVFGILFCTVAGYFALQPMMAAARAGQGSVSFGALHGISAGFFAFKVLLAAILAWRLTAPRGA